MAEREQNTLQIDFFKIMYDVMQQPWQLVFSIMDMQLSLLQAVASDRQEPHSSFGSSDEIHELMRNFHS